MKKTLLLLASLCLLSGCIWMTGCAAAPARAQAPVAAAPAPQGTRAVCDDHPTWKLTGPDGRVTDEVYACFGQDRLVYWATKAPAPPIDKREFSREHGQ